MPSQGLPERDGFHPAQLPAEFEERSLLARKPLAAGHVQGLAPPIPAGCSEMQHLATIADPAILRGERRGLAIGHPLASSHLRCPAALAGEIIGAALASMGELLAVGDQLLVQLTAQSGGAVWSGVVRQPVAGEADLAAAGGNQKSWIHVGPLPGA